MFDDARYALRLYAYLLRQAWHSYRASTLRHRSLVHARKIRSHP